MKNRLLVVVMLVMGSAQVLAEEGMWRLDQLPVDEIAKRYGVELTPQDRQRLHSAVVRILAPGSGGTGTFGSANALILTNHHVALDCIRTSTLAEQNKGKADNLIESGFTAASRADELPCKRFRVQLQRSTVDVTAELDAVVKPDMDIAAVQKARQAKRNDLERACKEKKGDNFSCSVVAFNSGATSLLITYEDFNDVRLVYAPEKQFGYFGGDEMNFRFPRYVSDISVLRAYVGKDGSHGDYDPDHVPVRPEHYLRVSFDGVKEGDFALVAGFPGNTNRYRMSFSAIYNLEKGIPERIQDYKTELPLLRKYAAMKPQNQILLQQRIFGLSNTLKYETDVLAALKTTNVVSERLQRERDFAAFLDENPTLAEKYGGVLDAQRAVYANDVEANEDLDNALRWLQRSSVIGLASGLYEFAQERAKESDRDREPQFQERFWPDIRKALLDDEPVISELEVDHLEIAFEKALALKGEQRIPAVQKLAERLGSEATARSMAEAIVNGSSVTVSETRKKLIDSSPEEFEKSSDAAVVFVRHLESSLKDLRKRVRVLNEKLFRNRTQFARGMVAWKGEKLYPDANFTLRVTYGKVAGYTDKQGQKVPFGTQFGGMFELAEARGDTGDFALPRKLKTWREKIGEADYEKFAELPMVFVSTNDITGGNSGSALLNRDLQIVGLIFDGNEESMGSDWTYSEVSGRALSTDIRLALTIAREVHGAGWIVDELLTADKPVPTTAIR